MKFLRNIVILCFLTLLLSYIIIHLAEVSSSNARYVYLIVLCILILAFRFLMNLNLWSSLKKDYDATPEELTQKSIKMEKYYVGEIFMFIVGGISFIYGYNEFILNGLNRISAVYFIGSIICFALIIKRLFDKKSVIEKITNSTIDEQNNLKKNQHIMTYVAIGLIILSFLYKFFN